MHEKVYKALKNKYELVNVGLEAYNSTLGMKDEILKPMYHHRHVQAFNGVGIVVKPVF